MFGPCMCGDYMCPSCGPAQGYDPQHEALREQLCEQLSGRLESFLKGIVTTYGPQLDDILETIADKVAKILEAQQAEAEMDRAREIYEERLANEY